MCAAAPQNSSEDSRIRRSRAKIIHLASNRVSHPNLIELCDTCLKNNYPLSAADLRGIYSVWNSGWMPRFTTTRTPWPAFWVRIWYPCYDHLFLLNLLVFLMFWCYTDIHPLTHSPAGAQHVSTHPVVLADELEDGDLEVFGELVLGWELCDRFIRDTSEKEAAEEKERSKRFRSHYR